MGLQGNLVSMAEIAGRTKGQSGAGKLNAPLPVPLSLLPSL
jgi:hypothetical protein